MPKLIVPDDKIISTQGAERNIQATAASTASGAQLGQLQGRDMAQAVSDRAKLGQITRTQGAEALADTGRQIGGLIGNNEAAAAASYAKIGNTALEAGSSVMRQGQQMFQNAMAQMDKYIEKSKGAVEDGLYNNVYSAATKEFNSRVMERMNQPYDEQGNPTFASLTADIGSISEDVKTKYSGQLGTNPEVLNRFDNSFTTMSTNQQVGAMKEARQQQVEYSKGSLENFLNTNTTSALSTGTSETLPSYVANANERIDSAYRNGYISYEQAVELKDKTRHDINYGYLENQAQKNPNEVFNRLGMDAAIPGASDKELGITPTEHAQLVDITAKRINQQRSADRTRVAEEKALVKEQQTYNNDNLDLGVAQGKVADADIDAAYNDGKISHAQMVNLKEKVISQNNKGYSKAQTRQAISTDLHSGKLIGSKYPPSAINDHYDHQVQSTGAQELFDTKASMDRTRLAAQYRAPVTKYTNELDSIAKGGTSEQIMQAAQSYKYVSQKSPLAVSKLNKQTTAFYNTINSQMKYANVDPQKAIERANTLVYQAQEDDYRIRRNEVDNKGSPFSAANIDKTITGMNWGDSDFRPGTYSNLKHVLGPTDKISEFAKMKLTEHLRDAYVLTGDYEAAKEMVQNESQGVFGTSAVNNMSNWTRDNSTLMFAPPEATYGHGTNTNFSSQEMRANLEHDASAFLVKGPYVDQSGVRPEQIMVGSGEFTARSIGNAKYMMYYVDDKGDEHPLVDPQTGQAKFWAPDAGYVSGYREQKVQEEFNKAYKVQEFEKTMDDNSIGGIIKKGVKAGVNSLVGEARGASLKENTKQFFRDVTAVVAPGSQQSVVNTALSFIGVTEKADRKALGAVMSRQLGQSVDPALTPWCAAFVNTVLQANHIQGTGSLAARSFLNWGQATWNPQKGDIVITSRGNDPSKGHVGFYMGKDNAGNILILGGNQSDSVSIKSINPNTVLSIRTSSPDNSGTAFNPTITTSTSTYTISPSDVLGFRALPSAEDAQQMFSTGPLSQTNDKALPVGIRQNNPGNIIKTGSRWKGEVPNNQTRFKEFATAQDGIGALVNNLKTNYFSKGYNTLEKIVKRWTETQKDWPDYIKNLSTATGLKATEKFDFNKLKPHQLVGLVKAMIKQENGYVPYSDSVIMDGILRGQ